MKDELIESYSHGMRQKLLITSALIHQPELIVVDEPMVGLDPRSARILKDLFRVFVERGGTVFLSSHTLSEVETVCDRVAIVRRGRIVADETLEALRGRAGRSVTIDFRDAESAARATPPAMLTIRERSAARWTGALDGRIPQFIAWLAAQSVEDLVLGPPDLETLFRGFYRDEEAAS